MRTLSKFKKSRYFEKLTKYECFMYLLKQTTRWIQPPWHCPASGSTNSDLRPRKNSVCVRVIVWVRARTCASVCVSRFVCMCMCVCLRVFACVCVCMLACVYLFMTLCACMSVCMRLLACTYACERVFACVYGCLCVYKDRGLYSKSNFPNFSGLKLFRSRLLT